MTAKQYFKLYSDAQSVWQVGDELYHEGYEKSARAHALRIGTECKRITRAEVEEAKADKSK